MILQITPYAEVTRNVEGQLLYHTMLLKSPWELPVNYQDQVLDLMAEKDPYLITRSQPDPNYPYDDWGEEYISSDRQKALQSIQTTKLSIVVLLNRIHKLTSHTFHVLIRELIPGAKVLGLSASLQNFLLRRWFIKINFIALL